MNGWHTSPSLLCSIRTPILMKRTLLLYSGLLLWAIHMATAAAPAGFTESAFLSDVALSHATGMAWAPDGSNRLFIIRKTGEVRVIKDGAMLPAPFARVSAMTNSECGLIGICFD